MSLESYVQSFSIAGPTEPQISGLPISLAAITNELLDIDTTEVINGQVDLSFVFKHLALPKDSGEIPWPAPAAVNNPVSGITSGLAAAPGVDKVEGWLATIKGTVPIGFRDISSTVRITFEWKLSDDNGELADATILGGATDAQNLTFVVPPLLTELNTANFAEELASLAAVRTINVALTVKGRIGNLPEVVFPVPPITISIRPVPLPSVAGLFRDVQLQGDALLVMVPKKTPLDSVQTLMGVLDPLNSLLSTVRTAGTVTSWAAGIGGLYAAVNSLLTRVPLTSNVALRARDEYHDLGKDNFIESWGWNDDIEDRGSSLLVVSATRSMTFFENDEYGGEKLTVDARPSVVPIRLGGAVVRLLHVSNPQSEPPGCVTQTGAPDNNWGDQISSYRWGDST